MAINRNQAAELLPCPFCGCTEPFIEQYDGSSSYVTCNNCGAKGSCKVQTSDAEENPGEENAKKAWNTRATPAVAEPQRHLLWEIQQHYQMGEIDFHAGCADLPEKIDAVLGAPAPAEPLREALREDEAREWAWLIGEQTPCGEVIEIFDGTATCRHGDDDTRILLSEVVEEIYKKYAALATPSDTPLREVLELVANAPDIETMPGAHLTDEGRAHLAFAALKNMRDKARVALSAGLEPTS